MTVRIHTSLVGVTQEQFDAVHKHVTSTREVPKGLIFHSSGPVDGGWIVIDFWESRQDFDAAMPRVQKAIEAAGVTMQGPPDIEEFPVYETIRP
jgi:quinol monooxygenase YgiN